MSPTGGAALSSSLEEAVMLRSLAGWICDLGAAFLALTAQVQRDRQRRRYQRDCWLDGMAAEQ